MAVANNKTFTLKSGEDMVISSTSKQVENTPPVSSPPLNNFFRMTKRQQQLRSKARSPKTIGLLQKSVQAAQSQDEESSGKTESAELSSGTSMEEIRNNSENCQLETDISSGGDMAISSNSAQVEEASNASSALINNSSRMARKPPSHKSILVRQPRLLLPKYIPSQLVDESKNKTSFGSVMEVLINDDSEMSLKVNASGKMGPPPPKPAGSSKNVATVSKAISKKAKGTAAPSTSSQAQKEMRNNSENCKLVPDISSGGDMAISSKSRQVEEASNASSALISNFSRMARKQQAMPFGTMGPPPQKSSLFSRGFPAVSPNKYKSILLRQPRILIPKYIPSQLVDETGHKNSTHSVMEVLINEDSEMSVNVNAPGKMGPPPPKPSVSTDRQPSQIATSVAKADGETAGAGLSSQAAKVISELIALQSRYILIEKSKNRLMEEFEKMKDEQDNMPPFQCESIKNMTRNILWTHKAPEKIIQEIVDFTEDW